VRRRLSGKACAVLWEEKESLEDDVDDGTISSPA
jgi:hypothetical protein